MASLTTLIRLRPSRAVPNHGLCRCYTTANSKPFHGLPRQPGYIDKTRFLHPLSTSGRSHLFLRPRGYGKALTVSMLEHFHDHLRLPQHSALFGGLAVGADVDAGRIQPGGYAVLRWDFARFEEMCDTPLEFPLDRTGELAQYINTSLQQLLLRYGLAQKVPLQRHPAKNFAAVTALFAEGKVPGVKGVYLLATDYDVFSALYLIDLRVNEGWERSEIAKMLVKLWEAVGKAVESGAVARCFITGETPLLLRDRVPGVGVAPNLSWNPRFAALCGATGEEVGEVLRGMGIEEGEKEREGIVQEMQRTLGGCRFSVTEKVQPVMNTAVVMEYLAAHPTRPPTTPEIPAFLFRAVNYQAVNTELTKSITHALPSLPWGAFIASYTPSALRREARHPPQTPTPAFRHLLLYRGLLTPTASNPSTSLAPATPLAAHQIGAALLSHSKVAVQPARAALAAATSTGDIRAVLALYTDVMARDADSQPRDAPEYRDRLSALLLLNPALAPVAPRVAVWATPPPTLSLLSPNTGVAGSPVATAVFRSVPVADLSIERPDGRGEKERVLQMLTLEEILALRVTRKAMRRYRNVRGMQKVLQGWVAEMVGGVKEVEEEVDDAEESGEGEGEVVWTPEILEEEVVQEETVTEKTQRAEERAAEEKEMGQGQPGTRQWMVVFVGARKILYHEVGGGRGWEMVG
ncbi:hypothetical protein EDC01DRAFT_763605 [Geopyxis carbonaria]|nr:hypothetical protein EDC01DRAFT_763605 [Geopyxis carbonaria]